MASLIFYWSPFHFRSHWNWTALQLGKRDLFYRANRKVFSFGSLDGLDRAQRRKEHHREIPWKFLAKEGINVVQGQSPRWPLGRMEKSKWADRKLRVASQCMDFPGSSAGKESACNTGDPSSIPGLGSSPGKRIGYPLQYSCLENHHGQRSLAGHSPGGCKELDTTVSDGAQHSTVNTQNCAMGVDFLNDGLNQF